MYDALGNDWETQSSAFTETLKSQIGTNASNITILQNSNSSLNSSISALQISDTAQNTSITALQTSDTAQNTSITALQISDTAQNTSITALQSKTQNITSSTTSDVTLMSKPLYISSADALRLYGPFSYISGWDSGSPNTRDWYVGTQSNNKQLRIANEKAEGIYLQTGSRTGNIITANSNLGQNKVVIHGLGISFKRGGISLNDNLISAGEIGALDPLTSHLYITGNGTNEVHINSGIGATVLNSNVVWIGSGTVNGAYGRKSNINMLNSSNVWETQSSAFTETLKARLLQPRSFNNTGKVEMIVSSFWWLGFAYNLTTLTASRLYDFIGEALYYGAEMSVGSWLNL